MIAAVVLASPISAQLTTEEAAFRSIALTPIGGLPEVNRVGRALDSASRLEVQLRYGRWKLAEGELGFQNLGATALVRIVNRLKLGGTIGRRSCDNCDGVVFGSADAFVPLFRQRTVEGQGYLTVELHGSAGFARYDTTALKARAIGALLPVSVSLPEKDDALVTIFVAPGLAYGTLTDDEGIVLGQVGTAGQTRGVISAGIGYVLPVGFGMHAAVHRILVKDSPTHVGVAASWRFGAQRSR